MDADVRIRCSQRREPKPCLELAWTLGTFFYLGCIGKLGEQSLRWPENTFDGPGPVIAVAIFRWGSLLQAGTKTLSLGHDTI